jgi:hypothetical protein
VGFAIYIEKYRKAKEEELYEKLNISPCKNIIFKKNPLKQTKKKKKKDTTGYSRDAKNPSQMNYLPESAIQVVA